MEVQPILIALGANLGEPRAQLAQAVGEIVLWPEVSAWRASSLYVGPYVGPAPAQPEYANAVLLIDAALDPLPLLARLHAIQARCERAARAHQAPRHLDLDLLLHGQARSDTPQLQLPHPRLRERRFVLEPLVELLPDLRLPPDDALARTLLAQPALQTQTLRRVATAERWLSLERACRP